MLRWWRSLWDLAGRHFALLQILGLAVTAGAALILLPNVRAYTAIGGLFLMLLLAWWQLPKRQVASLHGIEADKVLELEDKIRKTIAQSIGGLVLLIGLFFSWQEIVGSRESTNRQLRIAEDGQITERFSRAIDQLGDSTLAVRLRGIYGRVC